jgi:ABC-type branched-subunit amino acid transport system substrate-binding protein
VIRLVPALLAALLAACASQTTPPWRAQQAATPGAPEGAAPGTAAGGAPAVGLLLPLTGSSAKLGADFQDAAQMALFDVGETSVRLVPRDTGDTPESAVTAATAAMDAGATLLLGPLFGRSTTAVAPVAQARNVSVLSFSNDASVAAPGVYVLGFRPEEQVARIVDYAGRRGLSRFAALAPDDAYGNLALSAWRQAVGRLPGATIIGAERYPTQGGDPSAAVKRLVQNAAASPARPVPPGVRPANLPPFDSLLIADSGSSLRALVATLPLYNVAGGNTRLLGTMRWRDDPGLFAEQPVQGAWIASWEPPTVDKFVQRFQATYGRTPAPLAVLAYDGTALACLLAKSDAGFGTEQLTDPQGFTGGSGLFRLRPDGLVEHGLAVLEVRNGSAGVIDPAPKAFTAGTASR